MTKLIFHFYFCLTPMCSKAALISFTGAEKDLLWYFVFVEREQQARTGSQWSSDDRQALNSAAVGPTAVMCITLPYQGATSASNSVAGIQRL